MHRQPGIVLAGLLDDREAFFPGGRERLLDDRANAALGSNGGELPVGVHAGGDVDEFDLGRIKHLRHVGEVRNAELPAGRFGLACVAVADSGQDRALILEVGPGVEVVLRIEAAADNADRHAFAIFSHSSRLLYFGMTT